MTAVKKYKVTNLTTKVTKIYDEKVFALEYPETSYLMEKESISSLERNTDPDRTGFRYEVSMIELPTCQRCGAVAIVEVSGKTSDLCYMKHLHRSHDGYVLRDMGVGADDYLEFDFCVVCGQIQGEFPKEIHGRIVTTETEGYPYVKKA